LRVFLEVVRRGLQVEPALFEITDEEAAMLLKRAQAIAGKTSLQPRPAA
jgi:hypothetical protein